MHGFAGQIVRLVGRHARLELGQDVPLHPHRLFGLPGRQDRAQGEIPLVDLVGQVEVRRGYAVARQGHAPLEDLVAPRVFHFKCQRLPRQWRPGRRVQSQRAQVDRLPRLVHRLVGGQQGPHRLNQCERLRHDVFPDRRIHLHPQCVRARPDPGRFERGVHGPRRVRPARPQGVGGCLRPGQGQPDLGRDGPPRPVVKHDDAQGRRAAALPGVLPQHARLQRRDGEPGGRLGVDGCGQKGKAGGEEAEGSEAEQGAGVFHGGSPGFPYRLGRLHTRPCHEWHGRVYRPPGLRTPSMCVILSNQR